ncbi:MAG TPA: hypothetical protein VF850_00795 [Gemmatimonadaceae bacterium]
MTIHECRDLRVDLALTWSILANEMLDRLRESHEAPNVLPLAGAVLHTARARTKNDTPRAAANGTASGAAAELGDAVLRNRKAHGCLKLHIDRLAVFLARRPDPLRNGGECVYLQSRIV